MIRINLRTGFRRARDIKYEWILSTPVVKEFSVTEVVTDHQVEEFVEADGASYERRVERELVVEKKTTMRADRIRLDSIRNDKEGGRLFVRLIYGRLIDGKWQPASKDDGLVISGPNYQNIDLDLDGTIEENEVLLMCARILKWFGDLGEIGATTRVEAEPA